MLAPSRHDAKPNRFQRLTHFAQRGERRPLAVRERLGIAGGLFLVPWVGAGSYLRGARLFHPEGHCYAAAVTAATTEQPYASAAMRLRGEALVRLSAALWRESERFDVLGFTLRFQTRVGAPPAPGDQDLLLATIRSPVLLFSSLVTTRPRDFFANTFYGTSPFDIGGIGRVKIRLVPLYHNLQGNDRADIVAKAIHRGLAIFRLDVRPLRNIPYRGWKPLVEISIRQELAVDQERLQFSPFRNGRGIRPRGFIHYLRKAVYPASQFMRNRKKEKYAEM